MVVLSESPVFIVILSKSRLCATPFGTKHPGFPCDFFLAFRMEQMRLGKSVASFDQKVGLAVDHAEFNVEPLNEVSTGGRKSRLRYFNRRRGQDPDREVVAFIYTAFGK